MSGPTALDSSVIIASLLDWHEDHSAALDAINAAGDALVVPLHAIVESYSVMTRLPSAQRVTPVVAERLLRDSYADVLVADLPADQLWTWLSGLAADGVAGGLVYDARILESSRMAGATQLLTFNERHFLRLAQDTVEIVLP